MLIGYEAVTTMGGFTQYIPERGYIFGGSMLKHPYLAVFKKITREYDESLKKISRHRERQTS